MAEINLGRVVGEQGPQGNTGATGPAGPANTLTIGTVQQGDAAAATITGDAPNQTLNLTLPRGEQGPAGTNGADGTDGTNATITSASATVDNTSGTPACTITLGGTESARTFAFAFSGIKGEQGPQGSPGAAGSPGADGATGPAGPANTLTIGTVQQGDTAAATISGTAPNQVLNLTLPRGEQGPAGADGAPGAAGADGAPGQGVPTGGTAGQVLSKVDSTDYNTQWITPTTYTLPAATTSALGGVKPDGTSITVTGDGTISAQAAITTLTYDALTTTDKTIIAAINELVTRVAALETPSA